MSSDTKKESVAVLGFKTPRSSVRAPRPDSSGDEQLHPEPFSKSATPFTECGGASHSPSPISDDEGAAWFTVDDLATFKVTQDDSCLLGKNRFLCKGGSMIVVGESGIGKSSLAMQASVFWAAGVPFFGIPAVKPLKVLLIQRENDKGDLAEAMQGVLRGLKDPESRALAAKNLKVCHEMRRYGAEFAQWMHRAIEAHGAELVVCDNFMSFFDGDVNSQQDVGSFCRQVIQPVLDETQVALVFVHHSGKPSREVQMGAAMDESALKYYGIGSSELTNWPRAIAVLRQVKHGGFQFAIPKRGKRSGLCDSAGNPATSIYIKHATAGMYWEYAPEVEAIMKAGAVGKCSNGRPRKHVPGDLVKLLMASGPLDAESFAAKAETTGMSRSTYFTLRKDAVEEGLIIKEAGKFQIVSPVNQGAQKPDQS